MKSIILCSALAVCVLGNVKATDLDDLSNQIDDLNSKLEDVQNNIQEEIYNQSPEGRAAEEAWRENRARIDARHDREFEARQAKLKAQASSSQGYTLADMKRWRKQWAKLGKWDFVAKADARIKQLEDPLLGY